MAEGLNDFAELLATRREQIVPAWEQRLPRSLRHQEPGVATLELGNVFDGLLTGIRATTDARADAFGEVRALLTELSVSRARRGYSPTETASSIFSLKSAIAEVLGDDFAADTLRISTTIDDLGLFTFEHVRRRPRGRDRQPGRATARAVDPGGQAVGRRAGGAAGRHARLGAHPGGDGDAAAGRWSTPAARTRSSTSPASPRSTPRSPSTC